MWMGSHWYAQCLSCRSSPGSRPNVLWAFYSYSTFDLLLLQKTVVLITIVSQGTYILFAFHVPCIIAILRGSSERSSTKKDQTHLIFSVYNYLIWRQRVFPGHSVAAALFLVMILKFMQNTLFTTKKQTKKQTKTPQKTPTHHKIFEWLSNSSSNA